MLLRIASALSAACLLLGLAACSTLPAQRPHPATTAITDFAQTPLAKIVDKALSGDDRSGFRLQPYGPNSFATRIELARLATRSLDVQYYLLAGDNTGRALMAALRDAAARGVRVRLLIDDMYTTGEDELLLAMASYPNVEVRLFNPFTVGRGSEFTRFGLAAFDFARINHRMHNKLFIADNAAAVAGGRNMADAYVMNASGSNFIDMDTFVAGPAVRELSSEFDHYWNSDIVYPVGQIAHSARSVDELRADFDRAAAAAIPPKPADVPADGRIAHPEPGEPPIMPADMVQMLDLPFALARQDIGTLILAKARVLYDPLDKAFGWNESRDSLTGTVTGGVIAWLHTARSDIKMVSPYFIPSEASAESLVEARSKGVSVTVVTNSLASTDVPWVYGAYSPYLEQLLGAGVQVFELSPSLSVERARLGIFGNRSAALHMKSAIIDHAQVFLGSMNLDPRSALLNTELGLIIESPEMAQRLDAFADADSWYRLRLNPANGKVQWIRDNADGTRTYFDVPPETTFWQRLELRLVGPFVPVSDL